MAKPLQINLYILISEWSQRRTGTRRFREFPDALSMTSGATNTHENRFCRLFAHDLRGTEYGAAPKSILHLKEAAARWDCRPADLAGWADNGHFDLLTGIGPTETNCDSAAGDLSGFVVVSIAEIASLFLRRDSNLVATRLRHLRKPGEDRWHIVTTPSEGIEVTLDDLVMRGEDVFRFEKACDLPRRPAIRAGGEARYNWEAALSAEIVTVHERGVPATQAEWVGRVQEWFAANSDDGEVPDERTIRRRLSPIWKSLHEAA